jgi:CheY-like chemotaxis protein
MLQLLPMPFSLLLAEDNEDDAFFFKTATRKLGWPHRLIVAANGREAIAELDRYAANPAAADRLSLVLLDLKMPFVGGLEVLEWAHGRPEFRFLPMCVLSSSEQESDIETAYRLGAAGFLVKPANPDGLHDLLRTLEAFWLRHNRLPAARLDRVQPHLPAATAS